MSQRDVIDVVVPFYSVHSHISFGINQSVIYIFYKKLSQKCVVYFFPIRVQITGKILKKCHMPLQSVKICPHMTKKVFKSLNYDGTLLTYVFLRCMKILNPRYSFCSWPECSIQRSPNGTWKFPFYYNYTVTLRFRGQARKALLQNIILDNAP